MTLETSAFSPGQPIPQKYSCEGADVSPPLTWSAPPPGTKSFALIVDDPDAPAGTWLHWLIYNLPPDARGLSEGVSKTPQAAGGVQGENDFRKSGYGGPCPPPGKAHRYFFKLYALNASLQLPPGAGKSEVENAMRGHILSEAELMGTYRRSR